MSALSKKTRENYTHIQSIAGVKEDMNEVSEKVSRVLDCNDIIVSSKATLLGFGDNHKMENERSIQMLENRRLPEEYVNKIMRVSETTENIDFDNELTIFPTEDSFQDSETTILPIYGGGERLGSLALGRVTEQFSQDDLVLAE